MEPYTRTNEDQETGIPKLHAVLDALRDFRKELEDAGVRHAAVFGSVARGEATASSDIDVLVELDPAAHVDVFRFAGLQVRLSELLNRDVDLISSGGLHRDRHDEIIAQAIQAF